MKPNCRVVTNLDVLTAEGARFKCIYADPPWRYRNSASRGAANNHYQTMTLDEMSALPVKELADEEAHLHLWTTNAFLFDAITIINAWGFAFEDVLVWCKPQMGLGNYWRVSTEYLLLGVRGGLKFMDTSQSSMAIIGRRKHSEKPGEIRQMVERASPGPRLELFGRKTVPGWTVFGNEVRCAEEIRRRSAYSQRLELKTEKKGRKK